MFQECASVSSFDRKTSTPVPEDFAVSPLLVHIHRTHSPLKEVSGVSSGLVSEVMSMIMSGVESEVMSKM